MALIPANLRSGLRANGAMVKAHQPRTRTTFALNAEQTAALLRFASLHGRQWKSTLLRLWENGRDAYEPDGPLLRQIRHALGPSGLLRMRFPKEHRHDTV